MRSLNLLALILASFCTAVVALHESDVGIVDWHQPHAGVPLTSSLATAPTFHARLGRPPTEALLLTATSSNVLAALYASNGSLGMLYVFRLPISV
jgi:ER membrane protein complex subunit 1